MTPTELKKAFAKGKELLIQGQHKGALARFAVVALGFLALSEFGRARKLLRFLGQLKGRQQELDGLLEIWHRELLPHLRFKRREAPEEALLPLLEGDAVLFLDDRPGALKANLEAARLLAEQGNAEHARTICAEALRVAPGHPEVLTLADRLAEAVAPAFRTAEPQGSAPLSAEPPGFQAESFESLTAMDAAVPTPQSSIGSTPPSTDPGTDRGPR